jgi:sodium pump decarboxylase gamma subunit
MKNKRSEKMANLQVGLQLMVVGLSLVFFVLVLLMVTMKIMSAVILKATPAPSPEMAAVAVQNGNDKELAAVMAIAVNALEKAEGNIQINLNKN